MQGLLDLEGDSLTPILVSLVKKDAHMLDAFGKGASEDIRLAKQVRESNVSIVCSTVRITWVSIQDCHKRSCQQPSDSV